MRDMKVELIPLSQMNPAPYNPAVELRPGDPEYEAIKASIREFDLLDPLIWNQRSGNIIGGHQRYNILRDMGETAAWAVVQDLDATAERRANLALRKAQGKWDEGKLADLMADLRKQNTALTPPPGFDNAEMDALLARFRAMHAADFLRPVAGIETTPGTPPTLPTLPPGLAPSMAPPRDGSFRAPTSPLDGAGFGADEDEGDGEDDDEPGGEWEEDGPRVTPDPALPGAAQPGAQQQPYVTLQYAVTPPQRDIVINALRIAKAHFGLANSIEALVAVCAWYQQHREGAPTE